MEGKRKSPGGKPDAALRRRLDEAEAAGAELKEVVEALHRVSATLDLDELARLALEEIVRLVDPDVAMLHLREGQELHLKHTHPARRKYRNVGRGLHRVGECLCGLAARQRRPIYAVDIHADARCTLPECKQAGLRSFAALPLLAEDEVIGILGVGSGKRRDFSEYAAFLETLAARIAGALQNALLHERLRRHADRLEAEVERRVQAEKALKQLNATLEKRVAERTALAEQRAARLRSLAAELIDAEQRERRRVAEVLHEDFQQLLAAAKYRIAEAKASPQAKGLRRGLGRCDKLLSQAIRLSRSLTVELCPPILHTLGLGGALRSLARDMSAKHGLDVRVEVGPDAEVPSEGLRSFLFTAARELLFNVVKHAGTKAATVRLRKRRDRAVLEVRDAGRGFDPDRRRDADVPATFGLFSIGERAALLGGSLAIETAPGKGCKVTVALPLAGGSP